MKAKLLIIGLILSGMVYGQTDLRSLLNSNISNLSDSISTDSSFNICEERGHFWSNFYSVTLMACPSYIVDHENYTEEVFPACNYTTKTCKRCGISETKQNEEIRIVIWRRNEKSSCSRPDL